MVVASIDRTAREQSGTVQDLNERKIVSIAHSGAGGEIPLVVAPDKFRVTAVTFIPNVAVTTAKFATVVNRGTAGIGVGTGPAVENIVTGADNIRISDSSPPAATNKAAFERSALTITTGASALAGRDGDVNDVLRDEVLVGDADVAGAFIVEYETAGVTPIEIDSSQPSDSQGNPNFVDQPVTGGIS